MNRWLSSASVAGLLALPVALNAQPAPRPSAGASQRAPVQPVLMMEDQFEKTHNVTDYRGEIVVFVYGDRLAAAANKTLGEQIHVHFHPTAQGMPADKARQASVRPLPDLPSGTRNPEVRSVPVACIGNVPRLVRGVMRGQFRIGSPDMPVWLDFDDQMKKQEFPFTAGVPNVVVIDAAGQLRYSHSGQVGRDQFAQMTATIESLRKEAVGAK